MSGTETGKSEAQVIPFHRPKERFKIISEELAKGRIVEYDKQNVYSFSKKTKRSKYFNQRIYSSSNATRTFKNLKCNSCNNTFRVIALNDIQWSICPRCGGTNIDKLKGREEQHFEYRLGGI